jgi:hypothetical protein
VDFRQGARQALQVLVVSGVAEVDVLGDDRGPMGDPGEPADQHPSHPMAPE